MLSRRFLRIKVIQAVYAFEQEGPDTIYSGEKQLIISLNKLYELYIYQLSLFVEISDFAHRRMEENRLKYLPTDDDLNPNLRFIQNKFIRQLASNRDFIRYSKAFKINWIDEEELIRKLYNQMLENDVYQAYMKKESISYTDEKAVVVKCLLCLFSESELLRSYLEERSIYWSDDFDTSIMMVDKTIKAYKETFDEFSSLPTLLKDEKDENGSEDMEFVKLLYRRTLQNSNAYDKIIAERAANWDIERIALMDTILIKMAITELTEFPSIPVKVTLNEYIELSKEYSSAKSKIFINGVLDKLITDYKESGLIRKTGRGLME